MRAEGQNWSTGQARGGDVHTEKGRPHNDLHLILIEIANYAQLRRALGVQRAELLSLEVAERVAAVCPAGSVSTVGRNLVELTIGGEQAGFLGAQLATLKADCGQAVEFRGQVHRLHLVIGGASASDTDADGIDLIERAEQALVEARGDLLPVSAPHVTPVPTADMIVGRELRRAMLRDDLFVQYQPKLHLRRQEVTSLEALIRWHHPERGLVMPNDFIPAAERTGDIAELTLWTIRRVIEDQRRLMRRGHDLPVFVNMAGVLLSDDAFVEQVIALIEGSGAKLGIEITETSVIGDPQGAIGHLKRLSAIGVIVTIDDYGAGLSSLAYLKQLPASELKIDKLFVTQLSSSHRDPLIVRSTIDLAHALDMEVVAEGVETPASLALLTVMGCDMVQGFLISRPLSHDALITFLQDRTYLAAFDWPRISLGPSKAFRISR